jgi:hypothetical protein
MKEIILTHPYLASICFICLCIAISEAFAGR